MPPEDQPADEAFVDPVNAAQREFEAKRISRRSALRKLGLTFGQVSAGFLLSEPFVHAVAVRLEEHESNRQLADSLLDAIEHSAETLVKAEANLNCPPDPPPGIEAQRSSSSSATGGGGGGGSTRSSSSSANGGGGGGGGSTSSSSSAVTTGQRSSSSSSTTGSNSSGSHSSKSSGNGSLGSGSGFLICPPPVCPPPICPPPICPPYCPPPVVPPQSPPPNCPPILFPYWELVIVNANKSGNITVKQDHTALVEVGVIEYEFNGPIFMSTSQLTSGMSADFVPQSPAQGYGSTLMIAVDAFVALGIYPITVNGTASAPGRGASFNLIVVSD